MPQSVFVWTVDGVLQAIFLGSLLGIGLLIGGLKIVAKIKKWWIK